IEALRILAYDDQVDVFESGLDAAQALHRPQARVEVERASQAHVDALEPFADRRADGSFQRRVRRADHREHGFGQRLAAALCLGRARAAFQPLDAEPGGIDYRACGSRDLRADAVAGKQRDPVPLSATLPQPNARWR